MMYPEHPASDAMRQLVASPIEDIAKTLAAKTDEEPAELSMRQGYPRLEAAAFKTLSVRHGNVARLIDGMTLWKNHAGATEILDAVRSMGNAGGLA